MKGIEASGPKPSNQPRNEWPTSPTERARPGKTPKGMRKKTERKAKSARTTKMMTSAIDLPLFETVMWTS